MLRPQNKETRKPNGLYCLQSQYKNLEYSHIAENDTIMCMLTNKLLICILDKIDLKLGPYYSDLKKMPGFVDLWDEGALEGAALSGMSNVLALVFRSLKVMFVEVGTSDNKIRYQRFELTLHLDRLGPYEWSRGDFFHATRSEVFKVDFSEYNEKRGEIELGDLEKELEQDLYGPKNMSWHKFYDFKDSILDFSASKVHRLYYFLGKRSLIKIVNHEGTLLHRKSLYSQPNVGLGMASIIVPVPLVDAVRIKAMICVTRRDMPTMNPDRDYDISYRDFVFVLRLNGVAEVYKISHLKVSGSPSPIFSHQLMGPPPNSKKLRFILDPSQNFFGVRCGLARKTFVYKIAKHFSRYNKFPHDKKFLNEIIIKEFREDEKNHSFFSRIVELDIGEEKKESSLQVSIARISTDEFFKSFLSTELNRESGAIEENPNMLKSVNVLGIDKMRQLVSTKAICLILTYDKKFFKNFFLRKKLFQRISEFKAKLGSPNKIEIKTKQSSQMIQEDERGKKFKKIILRENKIMFASFKPETEDLIYHLIIPEVLEEFEILGIAEYFERGSIRVTTKAGWQCKEGHTVVIFNEGGEGSVREYFERELDRVRSDVDKEIVSAVEEVKKDRKKRKRKKRKKDDKKKRKRKRKSERKKRRSEAGEREKDESETGVTDQTDRSIRKEGHPSKDQTAADDSSLETKDQEQAIATPKDQPIKVPEPKETPQKAPSRKNEPEIQTSAKKDPKSTKNESPKLNKSIIKSIPVVHEPSSPIDMKIEKLISELETESVPHHCVLILSINGTHHAACKGALEKDRFYTRDRGVNIRNLEVCKLRDESRLPAQKEAKLKFIEEVPTSKANVLVRNIQQGLAGVSLPVTERVFLEMCALEEGAGGRAKQDQEELHREACKSLEGLVQGVFVVEGERGERVYYCSAGSEYMKYRRVGGLKGKNEDFGKMIKNLKMELFNRLESRAKKRRGHRVVKQQEDKTLCEGQSQLEADKTREESSAETLSQIERILLNEKQRKSKEKTIQNQFGRICARGKFEAKIKKLESELLGHTERGICDKYDLEPFQREIKSLVDSLIQHLKTRSMEFSEEESERDEESELAEELFMATEEMIEELFREMKFEFGRMVSEEERDMLRRANPEERYTLRLRVWGRHKMDVKRRMVEMELKTPNLFVFEERNREVVRQVDGLVFMERGNYVDMLGRIGRRRLREKGEARAERVREEVEKRKKKEKEKEQTCETKENTGSSQITEHTGSGGFEDSQTMNEKIKKSERKEDVPTEQTEEEIETNKIEDNEKEENIENEDTSKIQEIKESFLKNLKFEKLEGEDKESQNRESEIEKELDEVYGEEGKREEKEEMEIREKEEKITETKSKDNLEYNLKTEVENSETKVVTVSEKENTIETEKSPVFEKLENSTEIPREKDEIKKETPKIISKEVEVSKESREIENEQPEICEDGPETVETKLEKSEENEVKIENRKKDPADSGEEEEESEEDASEEEESEDEEEAGELLREGEVKVEGVIQINQLENRVMQLFTIREETRTQTPKEALNTHPNQTKAKASNTQDPEDDEEEDWEERGNLKNQFIGHQDWTHKFVLHDDICDENHEIHSKSQNPPEIENQISENKKQNLEKKSAIKEKLENSEEKQEEAEWERRRDQEWGRGRRGRGRGGRKSRNHGRERNMDDGYEELGERDHGGGRRNGNGFKRRGKARQRYGRDRSNDRSRDEPHKPIEKGSWMGWRLNEEEEKEREREQHNHKKTRESSEEKQEEDSKGGFNFVIKIGSNLEDPKPVSSKLIKKLDFGEEKGKTDQKNKNKNKKKKNKSEKNTKSSKNKKKHSKPQNLKREIADSEKIIKNRNIPETKLETANSKSQPIQNPKTDTHTTPVVSAENPKVDDQSPQEPKPKLQSDKEDRQINKIPDPPKEEKFSLIVRKGSDQLEIRDLNGEVKKTKCEDWGFLNIKQRSAKKRKRKKRNDILMKSPIVTGKKYSNFLSEGYSEEGESESGQGAVANQTTAGGEKMPGPNLGELKEIREEENSARKSMVVTEMQGGGLKVEEPVNEQEEEKEKEKRGGRAEGKHITGDEYVSLRKDSELSDGKKIVLRKKVFAALENKMSRYLRGTSKKIKEWGGDIVPRLNIIQDTINTLQTNFQSNQNSSRIVESSLSQLTANNNMVQNLLARVVQDKRDENTSLSQMLRLMEANDAQIMTIVEVMEHQAQTQNEQFRKLGEINEGVGRLVERIEGMERRMEKGKEQMEGTLGRMEERLKAGEARDQKRDEVIGGLVGLVEKLGEKLDTESKKRDERENERTKSLKKDALPGKNDAENPFKNDHLMTYPKERRDQQLRWESRETFNGNNSNSRGFSFRRPDTFHRRTGKLDPYECSGGIPRGEPSRYQKRGENLSARVTDWDTRMRERISDSRDYADRLYHENQRIQREIMDIERRNRRRDTEPYQQKHSRIENYYGPRPYGRFGSNLEENRGYSEIDHESMRSRVSNGLTGCQDRNYEENSRFGDMEENRPSGDAGLKFGLQSRYGDGALAPDEGRLMTKYPKGMEGKFRKDNQEKKSRGHHLDEVKKSESRQGVYRVGGHGNPNQI